MTTDAHDEELGSLAALARSLPREVTPPPDLWERIAARLEPRDRIDHLTASLPSEIDPPADLWPAIAARIAAKPRAWRVGVAAAAAATVVVAALVALSLQVGGRRDADSERRSMPVVADEATSDASSAAQNVGWILGAPALSGDVAASLSRELALVREQRLSIERAIATDPDDPDLRELWAFAYETELKLADTCARAVMEYERERG